MNPLSISTSHRQSRWRQPSWWLLVISATVLPLFIFGWALTLGSQPAKAAPEAQGGWQLAWSDEFNAAAGTNADSTKWIESQGHSGINNELAYYHPNLVYHDGNGNLVLESRNTNAGLTITGWDDGDYYSGQVTSSTKFDFWRGKVEVRGDLPQGKGIWPAYWTLRHDCTPAQAVLGCNLWPPEIDLMEFIGHQHFNVYQSYKAEAPGTNSWHPIENGPNNFADGYHTFTFEWDANELRFYFTNDAGQIVANGVDTASAQNLTSHRQMFILQTAIGGNWPGNPDGTTVFPQMHRIDYVRYYQWGTGATFTPVPTATRTPTPAPLNVPARIEAGGTANYTDSGGNVWVADTGFVGGGTVDRGAIAIANTVDDKIYQTERWGLSGYNFNIANGTYMVKLHFAETASQITAAGQRLFSVNVEGQTLTNLDVFAEAGGKNIALIKTFNNVNVTDGVLNMTWTANVEQPMVNGIEILPAGGGGCGTTNVALNRPATASSVEATGMEAAKAVDGNTTTRWSSLYSDPQWLYVDLGSTQNICRVRLNWEAAYGKSYTIQTSNDATNWTPIYSTTNGDGGIDDLTGLSGSGRYVRMHGTVRGTPYGYSLWELDVYAGGPTPTPTNTSVSTNTPTNTPIPPTNTPTNTPIPGGAYDDEFNVSTLAAKWSWIRQDATKWSLTAAPGFMRIICQAGDINGATATAKNILLETAPTGDWTVVTKLTGKPTSNWAQAGLIVYQNDDNWVKMVRLYDNANVFQFAKEIAGTFTYQNTADGIASTTSYLKIVKSGTSYSGYYSADGVNYTQVWTAQTVSLSTIKIGLISFAGTGLNADFDYIRVTTTSPTATPTNTSVPPTPTRTNTPAPGNTHGGTWAARATLNSPQTWKNLWQTDSGIATNTNYVASVWLKGTGSVELHVHNGAWTTTLSSTRCNATSTWTQCTSAAFNTGSNTSLIIAIGDPYNDDPVGTAYLDDVFLGVSGGANKVTNPGFESGNVNWTNDDTAVYSILQNP